MIITFIGCASKKEDHECRAIELYQKSALFTKEVRYATLMLQTDRIYILSAKHHLLDSDTLIAPYNITLNKMNKKDRLIWADIVYEQIKDKVSKEDEIYFLCGRKYYENLTPRLDRDGYRYKIPLQGVGGIGKQLQYLTKEVENYDRSKDIKK